MFSLQSISFDENILDLQIYNEIKSSTNLRMRRYFGGTKKSKLEFTNNGTMVETNYVSKASLVTAVFHKRGSSLSINLESLTQTKSKDDIELDTPCTATTFVTCSIKRKALSFHSHHTSPRASGSKDTGLPVQQYTPTSSLASKTSEGHVAFSLRSPASRATAALIKKRKEQTCSSISSGLGPPSSHDPPVGHVCIPANEKGTDFNDLYAPASSCGFSKQPNKEAVGESRRNSYGSMGSRKSVLSEATQAGLPAAAPSVIKGNLGRDEFKARREKSTAVLVGIVVVFIICHLLRFCLMLVKVRIRSYIFVVRKRSRGG